MRARSSSRAALPPLSLVMPRPQLPPRRYTGGSLKSPRTPLSAGSESSVGSNCYWKGDGSYAPRRSTDSWGSSNYGMDDDPDTEWIAEEVSQLSKALENLPAHLFSPFNGVVPPANILDKIARGIVQTKPADKWPHTVRATRVKLLQLARQLEDDEKENEFRMDISESGVQQRKRPLYRQSSMDFLQAAPKTIGVTYSDKPSTRAQRGDKQPGIAKSYHPYARPRSKSPESQGAASGAVALKKRTSADSLKRVAGAFVSPLPVLRRAASVCPTVASVVPAKSNAAPTLRRTESCNAFSRRVPSRLKRAPIFTPTPEEDENHSKSESDGDENGRLRKKSRKSSKSPSSKTSFANRGKAKPIQPSPSMFGAPLRAASSPAMIPTIPPTPEITVPLAAALDLAAGVEAQMHVAPSTSPPRTLRRVGTATIPSRPRGPSVSRVSRRISFGSLVPPAEEPEDLPGFVAQDTGSAINGSTGGLLESAFPC